MESVKIYRDAHNDMKSACLVPIIFFVVYLLVLAGLYLLFKGNSLFEFLWHPILIFLICPAIIWTYLSSKIDNRQPLLARFDQLGCHLPHEVAVNPTSFICIPWSDIHSIYFYRKQISDDDMRYELQVDLKNAESYTQWTVPEQTYLSFSLGEFESDAFKLYQEINSLFTTYRDQSQPEQLHHAESFSDIQDYFNVPISLRHLTQFQVMSVDKINVPYSTHFRQSRHWQKSALLNIIFLFFALLYLRAFQFSFGQDIFGLITVIVAYIVLIYTAYRLIRVGWNYVNNPLVFYFDDEYIQINNERHSWATINDIYVSFTGIDSKGYNLEKVSNYQLTLRLANNQTIHISPYLAVDSEKGPTFMDYAFLMNQLRQKL